MTPKEKAYELVENIGNLKIFIDIEPRTIDSEIKYLDSDLTKQCALIAVDEILNYLKTDGFSIQINYWEEVKQKILAL
jgi:hypothetical protein